MMLQLYEKNKKSSVVGDALLREYHRLLERLSKSSSDCILEYFYNRHTKYGVGYETRINGIPETVEIENWNYDEVVKAYIGRLQRFVEDEVKALKKHFGMYL